MASSSKPTEIVIPVAEANKMADKWEGEAAALLKGGNEEAWNKAREGLYRGLVSHNFISIP
jgi:hypothetical protein